MMDFLFDTVWRLYHGKFSGLFCSSLLFGGLFASWAVSRKIADFKLVTIGNKIGLPSSWVLMLLPFLLFFWAAYPGVYVIDSMLQLKQAMAQSYGDWHPPLMSWIWGLFIKFANFPEGLFWIHSIIVFFSLVVCAYILLKITRTPTWVVFVMALLLPLVLLYSGVIIKDTGTAFGLMAACGLVILPKLGAGSKLLTYFFAMLLLFCAASVRQNALPAILPILFLIFNDFIGGRFKKIKVVSIVFIVALSFHLFGNLTKYQFLKSRREFIQQTLMFHDLSFILLSHGGGVSIPDEFQTKRFSIAAVSKAWSPGTSATLFLDYDNPEHPLQLSCSFEANSKLKEIWVQSIVQNPLLYLKHRLLVFGSFLKLKAGYWGKNSSYPNEMARDHGLFLPSSLPGSRYIEHILSRSVGFLATWTPFASVWFWVFACAALSVIGFFRCKQGVLPACSLAIALSGLFYLAPYFFILPHCEYRYIYWSSIAATFSFSLLFSKPLAEKTKE